MRRTAERTARTRKVVMEASPGMLAFFFAEGPVERGACVL